jgi:hypothetical protein
MRGSLRCRICSENRSSTAKTPCLTCSQSISIRLHSIEGARRTFEHARRNSESSIAWASIGFDSEKMLADKREEQLQFLALRRGVRREAATTHAIVGL